MEWKVHRQFEGAKGRLSVLHLRQKLDRINSYFTCYKAPLLEGLSISPSICRSAQNAVTLTNDDAQIVLKRWRDWSYSYKFRCEQAVQSWRNKASSERRARKCLLVTSNWTIGVWPGIPLIYRVYQVNCSLKNRFFSASVQNIFLLKIVLKGYFIAVYVCERLEEANGWFCCNKNYLFM